MRYQRFDVEVTRSLEDLALQADCAGFAVLVRRKGIPVGFWMQESGGSTCVPAKALSQKISDEAGLQIIAESIRDEMAPSTCLAPLPLLTVAVCTKDRPDGVRRLLAAIQTAAEQLPAASAGLDLLIIDNASSDNRTREVAEEQHARYVREDRPGLNFARNRALREARGSLLAFVDDDVVPDVGWLAGLASAVAEDADACAYTGQVLPLELETDAQIIFEKRGGFRRGFERVRYGPVMMDDRLYPGGAGSFGAGANMAFKTDLLRSLGGFDEALDTGTSIPGGGDLDIFYRVIRAGYPLVYEPRFLVFHQHRRELGELARQYRRSWGLGFMCFLVKCLRTDRERRVPLVRLMIWWFKTHLIGVFKQLTRRRAESGSVPASMLMGELWGGILGLLGGYTRSERRTQRIREQWL